VPGKPQIPGHGGMSSYAPGAGLAVFKDGDNVDYEGIRAFPGRRGLARPLPRLCRRAHAVNDAEAASGTVLAGPRRPAPDALSHAASDRAARPRLLYRFRSAAWQVGQEAVWENAVHRVVTEGTSPEQPVDAAIARIKQILSE
jgi:hypothetical protein